MHGSTEGLTALVLDDHERIQVSWSALLAAAGMEHIGARDLGSAKALIGKHHVDIVVIDEHMADPQELGSDFAIWLREETDTSLSAIPILACTSDQSPATRERLLAAGGQLRDLQADRCAPGSAAHPGCCAADGAAPPSSRRVAELQAGPAGVAGSRMSRAAVA